MRTTSGVCNGEGIMHTNVATSCMYPGITVVGASAVESEPLEVSKGLHLAYSPPTYTSEQVGEVCVGGGGGGGPRADVQ